MTDIPELTEEQFEKAIPARLRKRLMQGRFESGEDIVALRRFVGLTQAEFARAEANLADQLAFDHRVGRAEQVRHQIAERERPERQRDEPERDRRLGPSNGGDGAALTLHGGTQAMFPRLLCRSRAAAFVSVGCLGG